jgi:hypothetical protein
MANKYRYRRGPQISRMVKKNGAVAIEQGDMLDITQSTGKVDPVAASGDCDDLVGIAMDASPATDQTSTAIRMLEIGHGTVFEMIVASATQVFGQPYVISGAQTLLKKTVTDLQATATNVVAVCAEALDTAGTSVLVQFLPGLNQKDIALS